MALKPVDESYVARGEIYSIAGHLELVSHQEPDHFRVEDADGDARRRRIRDFVSCESGGIGEHKLDCVVVALVDHVVKQVGVGLAAFGVQV